MGKSNLRTNVFRTWFDVWAEAECGKTKREYCSESSLEKPQSSVSLERWNLRTVSLERWNSCTYTWVCSAHFIFYIFKTIERGGPKTFPGPRKVTFTYVLSSQSSSVYGPDQQSWGKRDYDHVQWACAAPEGREPLYWENCNGPWIITFIPEVFWFMFSICL